MTRPSGTGVVIGRDQVLSFAAIRLTLFLIVMSLGSVIFALALLPPVGAAGRAIGEFSDKFEEIGADVDLAFPRIPERSTIFAADGSVLSTLYLDENRKIIRLNQVNQVTRDAVLSIEDARFYEHPGLDVQGILRALIANIQTGEITQGASTITQQLARNVFSAIGTEETLVRKIHEARVAMRLEDVYTKDQILELYLNEVYFGRGVYGIGTAAEYYFGTKLSKLTLPQASMLAGLISSPETYSPVNDPDAALNRRNVVIARMATLGKITPEQAAEAAAAPLGLHITQIGNEQARFPFFVEYLKSRILDDPRFGNTENARIKTLFQGGLEINTTLEPDLQRRGEQIVRSKFGTDAKGATSAIGAVDAETGAVLALVSGTDFHQSQVNLATGQGGTGRQSGSAFKPFTLVAALENGIPVGKVYKATSGQIVDCTPYGPPNYRAVNAGDSSPSGQFADMRTATAGSINAYFVNLAIDVGAPKIVEAAERMGIESPLQPFCSITLGTSEVTPLEMANGFATLANEGVHCEPFAITRVTAPTGKVLLKQKKGQCEQAVDRDVADSVAGLLQLVVSEGTGTAANLGRWPVFGKTGTTNDSADVWFSGCTRQICAATWVGHPAARIPMPGAYGGTVAAPIWHDFMLVAMQGLPALSLPPPPEPETARVPDVVGMTKAQATEVLTKAHFTPIPESVPSADPINQVVGQDPAGNSTAIAGSTVTIRLSNGKVPLVKVPDVVGLRETSALVQLQKAGFHVEVVYEATAVRRQNGRVISQAPGPGAELEEGYPVAIIVGQYAPPAPELPPPSPEGG
ncbi:MAG: transglycosylase domain-containing protein [Actinomycetota bacterium]